MLDLSRFVGFEWDEGNREKSVAKHGIGNVDAEQVFSNEPVLIVKDEAHSVDEARYHALGVSNAGLLLQVTFTLRQDETLIRIISVRRMNRIERLRYAQEA